MDKIFVKSFFAILIAILLWAVFFCKMEYIANENRMATDFSFSSPDGFFADRIPFREKLLKFNRALWLGLGKNEFSGAFFGKNGYIFSNEDVSINVLEKNLLAAQNFGGAICIVPSKTDALAQLLPRFYESGRAPLWQRAKECGEYIPNVLYKLSLEGANGKYIYYRGDHHLTSLGSYYLYTALADTLGFEPFFAEDFTCGVVKSDFSGTDARKMLVAANDKIALFRYKGDGDFLLENLDSGEKYSGLYNFDALGTFDPYGVFPIANAGRVRITKNGEKREKLLLIADSYGDSLAPFLARHFDIDMVDVRYYGKSVKELKEESDKILICFGMDTLASTEILYKLNVN